MKLYFVHQVTLEYNPNGACILKANIVKGLIFKVGKSNPTNDKNKNIPSKSMFSLYNFFLIWKNGLPKVLSSFGKIIFY